MVIWLVPVATKAVTRDVTIGVTRVATKLAQLVVTAQNKASATPAAMLALSFRYILEEAAAGRVDTDILRCAIETLFHSLTHLHIIAGLVFELLERRT